QLRWGSGGEVVGIMGTEGLAPSAESTARDRPGRFVGSGGGPLGGRACGAHAALRGGWASSKRPLPPTLSPLRGKGQTATRPRGIPPGGRGSFRSPGRNGDCGRRPCQAARRGSPPWQEVAGRTAAGSFARSPRATAGQAVAP